MYKLSVPVMNRNCTPENRESLLKLLKDSDAQRVFIALERDVFFSDERESDLSLLKSNITFFRSNDLETGVWTPSFGFGNTLDLKSFDVAKNYTRIRSIRGNEYKECDAMCPTDEQYMRRYLSYIIQIADCEPDLIMLDDEMCLSVRPGIGCYCDNHMKLINDKLGRKVSLEELKEAFAGAPNPLRNACMEVMGDTMREFCRKVRAAVDTVKPSIRLGFCAGYTSFDLEGADAKELSLILAGKNKPFLRFTGAPYWVSKSRLRFEGQSLNGVIECVRTQELYCRGVIEDVFHEADSYPRPRYQVPASYIELFDLALRASGGMGGLKYMADYVSTADYEKGYFSRHVKNKDFYEFIEKNFSDKPAAGVKIYYRMRKIKDACLPSPFINDLTVMKRFFSPAAEMLGSQCIPSVYDKDMPCGVAFGEDALEISAMPEKLITDINGAKILASRGIDTGLINANPAPVPSYEVFGKETVLLNRNGGTYFDCSLKDGAKVLSSFENGLPASFTFNNGKTEFLVFCADAYSLCPDNSFFRSYERQNQILGFCGINFPVIKHSPFVYTLCKSDGKQTAALFINPFEDTIEDPVIYLGKKYSQLKLFGAEGKLEGDKVVLSAPVPPFGAFAIVLG